uniref:Uncharacterized protein n=1 Tax=Arundo donax TaxID=35708 RepID=A0A0A9G0W2_ARUDO
MQLLLAEGKRRHCAWVGMSGGCYVREAHAAARAQRGGRGFYGLLGFVLGFDWLMGCA